MVFAISADQPSTAYALSSTELSRPRRPRTPPAPAPALPHRLSGSWITAPTRSRYRLAADRLPAGASPRRWSTAPRSRPRFAGAGRPVRAVHRRTPPGVRCPETGGRAFGGHRDERDPGGAHGRWPLRRGRAGPRAWPGGRRRCHPIGAPGSVEDTSASATQAPPDIGWTTNRPTAADRRRGTAADPPALAGRVDGGAEAARRARAGRRSCGRSSSHGLARRSGAGHACRRHGSRSATRSR